LQIPLCLQSQLFRHSLLFLQSPLCIQNRLFSQNPQALFCMRAAFCL
jgi:hypothetical protein